jgi:hypothetical protein
MRLGTTRLKFTDPSAAMTGQSAKTSKGPEEEVEGTIVRQTESMEVSEVEALLQPGHPSRGLGLVLLEPGSAWKGDVGERRDFLVATFFGVALGEDAVKAGHRFA